MFVVEFEDRGPIAEAVTKFGGQPVWVGKPQWPVGRTGGEPMRFVCQVRLPEGLRAGGQEMAYLFVSDASMAETWDPEFGDNAVILQPGPFEAHVPVERRGRGPTLQAWRKGRPVVWEDVEYGVELREVADSEGEPGGKYDSKTRIGGPVGWMQSEEWPAGGPWKFLGQIDSCERRFQVNFGDGGVGYIFVAEDGRRARFLWQCL